MKTAHALAAIIMLGFATILCTLATDGQVRKPIGKLVLFSDLADFQPPPNPETCIVKNRFKRGEAVGFRLFAVDGGTSQPEVSAKIVVHVTVGGKTYDVPALYRGIPQKTSNGGTMPVHRGIWTAKWIVPKDAQIGVVRYSATAQDKYGRTATWVPQGGEPSLLTVVE